MYQQAKEIGELQDSVMKLETEVSQLAQRQHRTREVELETLLAFCMQLRAFSARLFDLQTRLLRWTPNCTADEKTESEPECQP